MPIPPIMPIPPVPGVEPVPVPTPPPPDVPLPPVQPEAGGDWVSRIVEGAKGLLRAGVWSAVGVVLIGAGIVYMAWPIAVGVKEELA